MTNKRRSIQPPHLRNSLKHDEHVHISEGQIELKARRFFSNTFASEEIDEKKDDSHVCPVV